MPNVTVGLDQWIIARRGSTSADDAAPLTYMESKRKLAFSPTSSTVLVTSGLSGCIAVGLVGKDNFCLMHVYSGCDLTTWANYKVKLNAAFEAMGANAVTRGLLGYSDEVDKKQPTYGLIEGWLSCILPTILEYRNVGGAVQMKPSSMDVSFTGKANLRQEDYTDVVAAPDASLFIKAYGSLR